MTRRLVVRAATAAVLSISPAVVLAQRPARPDAPAQALAPEARAQAGGRRAEVEQRLRERFSGAVRQHLNLDERQVRLLQDHNRKFADRRVSLVQRERDARVVLREELQRDQNADNPKVATALQELMKVQKERSALLEEEDKSLGEFLTPVQRARYFALQEAMRKRIEELRRKAGARGLEPMGPASPAPGGPPEGSTPAL